MLDESSTIGILGAGTMGSGLAVSFARHGCPVTLYDVSSDALERARSNVSTALDVLSAADFVDADDREAVESRIETTESLPEATAGADAVVEAAPEDLEIKQELFGRLDDHVDEEVLLATNTSGLSITEIATAVSRPERLLGTHWFNPPYVVPLVELVYGEETADETVDTFYEFTDAMGKTPVVVRKDVPGFIANRLQVAMDYEAWSLLERGVASAEDIDRAVQAGFGFRLPALGVFAKADFAGLDVFRSIEEYLVPELDRGTDPNERLVALVEEGKFGLKSGEGVYDWREQGQTEAARWRDEQLLEVLGLHERLQER